MAEKGTLVGEVQDGLRRFWALRWWIKGPVLAAVVLIAVAGIVAAAGGSDDRSALPAQSEPSGEGSADARDTAPDASATSSRMPTATPTPSLTPTPTATPTPSPTPTPTFEPISLQGSGQTATEEFDLPPGLYVAHLVHRGSRNFIVWAYASDGDQDLLVNEIGPYDGRRPLVGDKSYLFDVDADGSWSIDIVPVGFQASAARAFEGRGDDVSGLFPGPGRGAWEFEHDGSHNFIVWSHCSESGSDLVQNEIGPTSGSTVVTLDGLCFWEVEADGSWSLRIR